MTLTYNQETFYCTMLLTKNNVPLLGKTCTVSIMRNSDNKFLDITNSSWGTEVKNVLTEIQDGIYSLGFIPKNYNNNLDTYTLIYKYDENNLIYPKVETIKTIRKNSSKLV